jgi:hypothetical protein
LFTPNCTVTQTFFIGSRVFKDERKQPLKTNPRYAMADHPEGPFGKPGDPFTGDWVEGPSAIKIKDEYLV